MKSLLFVTALLFGSLAYGYDYEHQLSVTYHYTYQAPFQASSILIQAWPEEGKDNLKTDVVSQTASPTLLVNSRIKPGGKLPRYQRAHTTLTEMREPTHKQTVECKQTPITASINTNGKHYQWACQLLPKGTPLNMDGQTWGDFLRAKFNICVTIVEQQPGDRQVSQAPC